MQSVFYHCLENQLSRLHDNENERGQMSPRQGEEGENTPFTKQCRQKRVLTTRNQNRVTTMAQLAIKNLPNLASFAGGP